MSETSEERDNSPCYVARHSCGHIVGAVVIEHGEKRKREIAGHVADWIKRGDSIEQMRSADVRAATWCSCFNKKRTEEVLELAL